MVFRSRLITLLLKEGFDVTCGGYDHHSCSAVLSRKNIEFVDFGDLNTSHHSTIRFIKYSYLILHALRKSKTDLVHLYSIQPIIFGAPIAKLLGLQYVISVTGLGHFFIKSNFSSNLVKFMLAFAVRNSKFTMYLNYDDLEKLKSIKGISNFRNFKYIPGEGVKVDGVSISKTEKNSGDVIRFVMVARLLKEKGLMEYINAAKIVQLENNSQMVEFTLIGDVDPNNPSSLSIDQARKICADAKVHWLGYQKDVKSSLGAYDVMVLPSYREGLSVSLLEGANARLALIATDVPGCKEIVIEMRTGRLIQPQSVDMLVGACNWYINNPQMIKLHGNNAFNHVDMNFSDAIVHEKILKLYNAIKLENGI